MNKNIPSFISYKGNDKIHLIRVDEKDYSLLNKFTWYLHSDKSIVTLLKEDNEYYTLSMNTVIKAIKMITERYEKSGWIFLGEYNKCGDNHLRKYDLALMSRYGFAVDGLYFSEKRNEYITYLREHPNFLERFKIIAFLKLNRKRFGSIKLTKVQRLSNG